MYKLTPDIVDTVANITHKAKMIIRLSDNAWIPIDPANTDYQKFKKDLADGAELQDADGNVMTSENIQEFISTLP